MKNVLPFLVLLFLSMNPNNLFGTKSWNKVKLAENEHVELILHHFTEADLGDKDWLKLELRNKTHSQIFIQKAYYNGNIGQSNKFDLLHFYHNLYDPSSHRLEPIIASNSSIFAWKYLTNYASVLIDNPYESDKDVDGIFNFKFEYKIESKKHSIECKQKQFRFHWTNAKNVKKNKLVKRLKGVLKDSPHRWVNSYVVTDLMCRPEILKAISAEELIKAVLLRDNIMNSGETILLLKELRNRNISPNEQITSFYRKKIQSNHWQAEDELPYYWDSTLVKDLLQSEIHILDLQRIFETNSNYWKNDTAIANLIFSTFKNRLEAFEVEYPTSDSIKWTSWAAEAKILATSRSQAFYDYIKPFLENQNEYEISYYPDKTHNVSTSFELEKLRVDTVNVRVCDAAFVATLRALDQIDYQESNQLRSVFADGILRNEVLGKDEVSNFPYIANGLYLANLEIDLKLTPERKKKVLEMMKL